MDTILALKNIEYTRGNGFQLQIESLEFVAEGIYLLSGPNGAGKSTLLHLLAMLIEPTRGEIVFDGKQIKTAKEKQQSRRQVTLVEQSPFLFDTSVYQNLAFGLRLRDIRGDLQQRRITSALKAVGLEGFESRKAKELSGGETRRVALARAIVLRPRVLLLDEPTAGLDVDFLPVFEDVLSDLAAKGVTIIMASHDAEQPYRLGGTVIHLNAGRLDASVAAGRVCPYPIKQGTSGQDFI